MMVRRKTRIKYPRSVDHCLIALAEKHAGAERHALAQRLTTYQLGAVLMLRPGITAETRAFLARKFESDEQWLRAFVARRRTEDTCRDTVPR